MVVLIRIRIKTFCNSIKQINTVATTHGEVFKIIIMAGSNYDILARDNLSKNNFLPFIAFQFPTNIKFNMVAFFSLVILYFRGVPVLFKIFFAFLEYREPIGSALA